MDICGEHGLSSLDFLFAALRPRTGDREVVGPDFTEWN